MENEKQLDRIFFALSDGKRRQMVEELSEHALPVGDIAQLCDLKMSAASKHLRHLEEAGIVYKSKRGRTVYCHMNFEVWQEVASYIAMHARFWSNRLNALEAHLEKVTKS